MFRDEGYSLLPAVFIFSSYPKCCRHVVHPRHPIRCDLKGFPEIFYRGITYENSFSEKIKKR
jgi:hypothetical protein